MTSGQPARPANMQTIVAINQGKRPLTMKPPQAQPLTATAVQQAIADNAVVLDVGSADAFAVGHIPNSLYTPLDSPNFEQWVGWIVSPDSTLILLTEEMPDVDRALHKLAFLGLDSLVSGFLPGGIKAWQEAGLPVATLPQMSVHQLHNLLSGGSVGPDRPRVLDVREEGEWTQGHIDEALHLNFKQMNGRLATLPWTCNEPIAVICAVGVRSTIAASLLLRSGYTNLYNISGGMNAWNKTH